MSSSEAREVVLQRIRSALADRPAPEPINREYDRVGPTGIDTIALFAERVDDYRAVVEVVGSSDVPAAIGAALSSRGITRIAVPPDLPMSWLSAADGVMVEVDGGVAEGSVGTAAQSGTCGAQLTNAQLDGIEAVVTGAAVGIALTGTIVLDAGVAQGRRVLTLLPDVHICVIRADQVVMTVPEALERLTPTNPLTWISGPSATSDIELNRVEGVHGPRTLHVLIIR